METVRHNQRSSTSAEVMDIPALRYASIGKTIAIEGRDITLGQHQAPPILQVGELHSLRMAKGRVVLVLLMRVQQRQFRQPRVIEVLL